MHGVVFPTERQAPLSPAAVKASAGATEHLHLVPVDDLAATLTDLHLRGLRIVGSDAEAALTAREADLRGPIALVVGSEGHGLSPAVRRRCDLFVRLPMRGAIGSLNAAVAGSVLLFEIVGQRDAGRRSASETSSSAPRRTTDRATAKPDGNPAAKRRDRRPRRPRSAATSREQSATGAATAEALPKSRPRQAYAARSAEAPPDEARERPRRRPPRPRPTRWPRLRRQAAEGADEHDAATRGRTSCPSRARPTERHA